MYNIFSETNLISSFHFGLKFYLQQNALNLFSLCFEVPSSIKKFNLSMLLVTWMAGQLRGRVLPQRIRSLQFRPLPRHLEEVSSSLTSTSCCLYQHLATETHCKLHSKDNKHLPVETWPFCQRNYTGKCLPIRHVDLPNLLHRFLYRVQSDSQRMV